MTCLLPNCVGNFWDLVLALNYRVACRRCPGPCPWLLPGSRLDNLCGYRILGGLRLHL